MFKNSVFLTLHSYPLEKHTFCSYDTAPLVSDNSPVRAWSDCWRRLSNTDSSAGSALRLSPCVLSDRPLCSARIGSRCVLSAKSKFGKKLWKIFLEFLIRFKWGKNFFDPISEKKIFFLTSRKSEFQKNFFKSFLNFSKKFNLRRKLLKIQNSEKKFFFFQLFFFKRISEKNVCFRFSENFQRIWNFEKKFFDVSETSRESEFFTCFAQIAPFLTILVFSGKYVFIFSRNSEFCFHRVPWRTISNSRAFWVVPWRVT